MRERVEEGLELVGLADLGARYPRELSGGQQQRVALARALSFRPSILLLDEPLSNLDYKLRQHTLAWLLSVLRQVDITAIYVTHDQNEALAISDLIGVMRSGELVQIALPEEIYERPESRFVAEFVGSTNLLAAKLLRADGDYADVELDVGGLAARARLPRSRRANVAGQSITVIARPETVRLHESEPSAGGIQAVVDGRVYLGSGLNTPCRSVW